MFEINPRSFFATAANRQIVATSQKGGTSCGSIVKVVSDCELVLTSLPNPEIVRKVMLSSDGILNNCQAGVCVLDLSSVDPETSRDIYSVARELDVDYADVPVSGGVKGAAEGTLTLMFGGERRVYSKVLPMLRCIGKKIIYTGAVGNGDAAKVVNNLLLGCNMAAISEALNLGRQLGLSLETMERIIFQSSGNSYAFSTKVKNFVMKDDYEGGFALNLAYKDMNLAVDASKSLSVPMPMTAAALQLYVMARGMDLGNKDISSVVRVWENRK